MKSRTAGRYQKWVRQVCFCLGLASYRIYRVAGRRAVKCSCHAGGDCLCEGLGAAKPRKTSSATPSSNRRRIAKDQLLRRLQDHATSKGGSCLADSYLNNRTKVQWECEHGHRCLPLRSMFCSTRAGARCALLKGEWALWRNCGTTRGSEAASSCPQSTVTTEASTTGSAGWDTPGRPLPATF